MPINLHGGSIQGTPSVNVQTGDISLTNATIAEFSPPGTVIGVLKVDLPGAWTFSLVDFYDNIGTVNIAADGKTLITTLTALVYLQNPTPLVRVVATRLSPYKQVVRDVQLILTPVTYSEPTPTIDLDLINKVYTGAALSDLGLLTTDLGVDGYANPGALDQYLTGFSMAPASSGWGGGGGGVVSTLATTSEGFTPIIMAIGGGGGYYGVSTFRSLNIGELVRISVRVGPVSGYPQGLKIGLTGAVNWQYVSPDNDLTSSTWRVPGYNDPALDGYTKNSDGSYTLNYVVAAGANAPLFVGVSGKNATELTLYGIQIHTGRLPKPWVATGSGGLTNTYKNITLAGAMATLMNSTAWTVCIECHRIGSDIGSIIMADTTSTIASETGFTDATVGRSGSTCNAKVGTGGFLGITRLAIAGDSSGVKVSLNGGVVATSSTPLTFSGAILLLTTAQAILRRVSLWNTKLSDTDIRSVSSIGNRTMLYPGAALIPVNAKEVFFDDFTSSSTLRKRPGSGQSFVSAGSFEANIGLYDADPGNWIGRYVHWDQALGSHLQSINGERSLLIDPQFCGDGSLTGGYLGPIDFNTPSCMAITLQTTASLPAAMQALIPNEQQSHGSAALSTKWQCVSGGVIAAKKAQVGVNSFWTFRCLMPGGNYNHPALWGLGIDLQGYPGYRYGVTTELDILEIFGAAVTGYAGSVHANGYGFNYTDTEQTGGYDMTAAWHTYEAFWTNGHCDFGLSGMKLCHVDTTSSNMDQYLQFPMINNAVWSNPTTAQLAAMPSIMYVDNCRLMTMGIAAPTLQTLALSTVLGPAASFTATVSQNTPPSSLSLIDSADGVFVLSGTTLVAASGVAAGNYSVAILETLSSSANYQLVSYFTITLY